LTYTLKKLLIISCGEACAKVFKDMLKNKNNNSSFLIYEFLLFANCFITANVHELLM